MVALGFAIRAWVGNSSHKKNNHCSSQVKVFVQEEAQQTFHENQDRRKKCCKRRNEQYSCKYRSSYHDSHTPSIDELVFVDKEPVSVNKTVVERAMVSDLSSRNLNLDGSVDVRILVDEKGQYRAHKIISRSHPILQDIVENKIDLLIFKPAQVNDQSVKYWTNLTFELR